MRASSSFVLFLHLLISNFCRCWLHQMWSVLNGATCVWDLSIDLGGLWRRHFVSARYKILLWCGSVLVWIGSVLGSYGRSSGINWCFIGACMLGEWGKTNGTTSLWVLGGDDWFNLRKRNFSGKIWRTLFSMNGYLFCWLN